MKVASHLLKTTLLCLAVLIAAPPAAAQTKAEIDKVAKILEDGAQRFLKLIDGVNEQQWNARVGTIRHTIGEEAEHISLSENDLQQLVQQALQFPAIPGIAEKLAGKEKVVYDVLLGEEKAAENFDALKKLINKGEVLEFYGSANRKLMTLLRGSKDLSVHVRQHPVDTIGELTGLQWFYYIAYHRENHIRQIEAIQAHSEYPGRVQSAD